jgi:RimJ/RimL family protein N-acetyltransferase
MQRLEGDQFGLAQPLFTELAAFNLSVEAVLVGTAPGEIYVDQIDNPRVALAFTPEGEYLAGDADVEAAYEGLQETISPRAYLIFHPDRWETKLGQIWVNQAARRHARQHLRFERARIPDWRHRIPAGFQLVQVDRAFLARTDLKNHDTVVDRLGGWHSVDYFLQHGFGLCILEGDTVASCCFADCVVGNQCEMGIATDMAYRRRGLATVVVAATVEYCLANGLTQIGWHCLQSNVGSRAVAEKVGFAVDQEYFAYSSVLPAESAADMTLDEYEEWANHYERFIAADYAYGYDAAAAWALAGDPARALAHLQTLLDHGWKDKPEWLERDWPFASLRGMPEFETMVARLR